MWKLAQKPLVRLCGSGVAQTYQLPQPRRHRFSARLMPLEVTAVGAASHIVQVIRFATFEVDLRSGEVRKSGVRLKLSDQPFQVLAILLEQPGQVVSRDELQKRLWPDTFVDVDHNLNTAINKIRDVLGDSSENPRFVETLPRRGYRFIAPVEIQTVNTNGDGSSKAPVSTPEQRLGSRLWLYAIPIALAVVLCAAIFLVF